MLNELKRISDLKDRFIEERKKLLASDVAGLQKKLYARLLDEVINQLTATEGNFDDSEANQARIAAIDKLFTEFENDVTKVMANVISGYSGIGQLSQQYFGQFNLKLFNKAKQITDAKMRNIIGIDEKGKAKPGGWIDSFIKDKTMATKVKQAVLSAVTAGSSLKDTNKTLNTLIQGSDQSEGIVQAHFRTNVYDTFSRFDRINNDVFAAELDLNYGIYAGGLVEHSRPFCQERNGKVFTREEIKAFGTPRDKFGGYTNKSKGEFAGKNKDYIPERDLGGYNCGHTVNWITYELAVQLRPDLKKAA